MLRCFAEVNYLPQLNHNEINFTQGTLFSLIDRIQTSFSLCFSSHQLTPINQKEKKQPIARS